MTKDEWRKLDKAPGMPFRLSADGRIGKLLRCHKDAAVLLFRIEGKSKGLYIREEEKYCPCEMLLLPDARWKKQRIRMHRTPNKNVTRRVIKKNCEYCGAQFETEHKDARFCSRKCAHLYSSDRAKQKRDACKPGNWRDIVRWYLARGITAKAGAALCHVSPTIFKHWVEDYKADGGES